MTDVMLNLVEQSDARYFSIDSGDRKEYFHKRKTGLLQRQYKGGKHAKRIDRAIELGASAEAKSFIPGRVTAASLKIREKELPFNPARILRDNELILKTIRRLKPIEWKLIFRAERTARVILKPESKEKKSDFTYFSILIKLRLKDHRNFIEIGEGDVNTPHFNQDGLSSRLKKVVENHKNKKNHRFAGKVPVILAAGDGAILFHELLGHSLEADHVFHGQSPITPEDIGKPIVSSNVTLVTGEKNDTFFNGIACDDDGESVQSPVLVENGVLRHLIADRFYGERLKLGYCGHSRVEDFTRIPMPRMFSLYLKPGKYDPGELIAATPQGVFAGEFGDGKVYFEKNLFYFHIRDARLIQQGKLTAPLGSIVVRGNISEVLNSVAMVANDFRCDKGVSYCFKNGQTVNVRVGQPTVKIDNLWVTKDIGE